MTQAEQSGIVRARDILDLEQIAGNIFRSKSLAIPTPDESVYGGLVVAQAVASATKCVDPAYGLTSLHCYFLISPSRSRPVTYCVEMLPGGRAYNARGVKALQDEKIVAHLLCSFHRGEPWQPSYQWPMPADAPILEECELDEVMFGRLASREDQDERLKATWRIWEELRTKSPVAVRRGQTTTLADGTVQAMWWMQARDACKHDPTFQKCVLVLMSDINFYCISIDTLKLKRYSNGPNSLTMSFSLDHSVHFYGDNFDCAEGMLYVTTCPRAASGRAIMHGRLYNRSGTLVAFTSQEAVVRANTGETTVKTNL